MPRHARLGSRGYNSFIAPDLTARGLHYRKEMGSNRYFEIKSLLNAQKLLH
jgi:hypothetical protein